MVISLYIELEKRTCNNKPLDRVMKETHDKKSYQDHCKTRYEKFSNNGRIRYRNQGSLLVIINRIYRIDCKGSDISLSKSYPTLLEK